MTCHRTKWLPLVTFNQFVKKFVSMQYQDICKELNIALFVEAVKFLVKKLMGKIVVEYLRIIFLLSFQTGY